MFSATHQKGCLSVFYSLGSAPLGKWSIHTANGYVKRVFDDDLKSIVLEISGSNVSTMYMEIPKEPKVSLGIKLPFLVLLIKNMGKYFTFEVKILDDQRSCRRFRASNFQSSTSVHPFCTVMPMGMSPGWNQIHFNLADFTRRAYGTSYLETVHLQVHANCRIRRIYFTDRLYTEEELPNEYRMIPLPKERKAPVDFKVPSARPPSPNKSLRSGKTEAVTVDIQEEPTETAPFGEDGGVAVEGEQDVVTAIGTTETYAETAELKDAAVADSHATSLTKVEPQEEAGTAGDVPDVQPENNADNLVDEAPAAEPEQI